MASALSEADGIDYTDPEEVHSFVAFSSTRSFVALCTRFLNLHCTTFVIGSLNY